jgi:hypothetical protein
MSEEYRPTGIMYEDAEDAAKHGGSIDFEGRKVRVVSLGTKSQIGSLHTARLEFDLGDGYLALIGYWDGGEFIETGRESPF